MLTPNDLDQIHNATLRILSEIGVVLTHPAAREVLTGSGAAVHGDRVLLPPDLVENAIAQCPPQVRTRGRNEQEAILGDGSLHWHNVGGVPNLFDPSTGQRRPAVALDVCDSARLLDALENLTTLTPLFTPTDVPAQVMSLAAYRHTLSNTTKPVHGPGIQNAAEVVALARMAAVIGPPAETLTIAISPVSPLSFPDDTAAAILETARLGIPFGPLPSPTAGATAPMSLSGALAQQNAEVLASIVLAQTVHPGLPVFYCGRLAVMDPRTGIPVWGGVESSMASAATVQIGQRYSIPVNVYGFCTDAITIDVQSGYERAFNAILPALAGADELSGFGEMAAGVMASYAQLVIDDEIAASVRRACRGFAVDEDALAVEVIAAVMDDSRNFLGQRHTIRYLRAGETLQSLLADRRTFPEWDRDGRDTLTNRAQSEATRLLADHQVPPLSPDQEQELDEIIKEFTRNNETN